MARHPLKERARRVRTRRLGTSGRARARARKPGPIGIARRQLKPRRFNKAFRSTIRKLFTGKKINFASAVRRALRRRK